MSTHLLEICLVTFWSLGNIFECTKAKSKWCLLYLEQHSGRESLVKLFGQIILLIHLCAFLWLDSLLMTYVHSSNASNHLSMRDKIIENVDSFTKWSFFSDLFEIWKIPIESIWNNFCMIQFSQFGVYSDLYKLR